VKFVFGAAAAAFALALVSMPVLAQSGGVTGAQTANDQHIKVRVMDNFFDPRSTSVAQDGKVTFVWKGTNRHNVRFTKVPKGANRKGSKTKRDGKWSRKF